jgi:protocatechuate 3,4-dioxygenase beta subunit
MLGAMVRALACFLTAATVGVGLAVTASATPAQARCQPTVGDGAGPFQQNAIATPRRAKIGTGHVLLGRVLRAPDCKPVARAVVYLWQAGLNGYGPRGRGSVVTDRAGRFRFEGPVPANYGRGPHIHIAVVHPAYDDLLTRYVVRPGAKTGRIRLVLNPLL